MVDIYAESGMIRVGAGLRQKRREDKGFRKI